MSRRRVPRLRGAASASSPPTPSYRLRREPIWRYVVLFVLTVASTTQAGGLHYASFIVGVQRTHSRTIPLGELPAARPVVQRVDPRDSRLPRAGSLLRVPLLPASTRRGRTSCRCRFLLTGTLGAFIRIRAPIPGKRALFDIGSRGADRRIPRGRARAARSGCTCRPWSRCPTNFAGEVFELGEPLLFKAADMADLRDRSRMATR